MLLWVPKINILNIKNPCGMDTSITVPCRQLLKNIHVPNLNVIVSTELIAESCKKPVLVEIIIYDLLTSVDVHLVIQNE